MTPEPLSVKVLTRRGEYRRHTTGSEVTQVRPCRTGDPSAEAIRSAAELSRTISVVGDVADRDWMDERLTGGATVTALAKEAGVSRQTVYTWLARHRLEPNPWRKPRPDNAELAALYATHGSAAAVAGELAVSEDTARRWLHAAGADIAAVRHHLDIEDLRRRRGAGATLQQLADEVGVSAETIRRRLSAP